MANRREFLHQAAIAGSGVALGVNPLHQAQGATAAKKGTARAAAALRVLILGGTGFIGPHFVQAALERGHKVAVFNRGKANVDLPAGVEKLVGDRNGQLESIMGRDWDAVFDLGTFVPNWVRTVGEALQGRVGHYTFVSTSRVYGDKAVSGTDETAKILEYQGDTDPFSLTGSPPGYMVGMSDGYSAYGALKVLAEREAERQFPGKALILRPGTIIGPRDDMFSYWVSRLDKGGEVLAPGNPLNPQQLVDARDFAEWAVRAAESRVAGIFNAQGNVIGTAEVFGAIRGAQTSVSELIWVPEDWLLVNHVQRNELPGWFLSSEDGRKRLSNAKARAAGLTFRPLCATFADTLDWLRSQPAPGVKLLAWSLEREQQVLAAWRVDRAAWGKAAVAGCEKR
ncbi:MAG: NAD-dependent epimerase/dehydratase family protein [Steroidobacteraceae bacterium]